MGVPNVIEAGATLAAGGPLGLAVYASMILNVVLAGLVVAKDRHATKLVTTMSAAAATTATALGTIAGRLEITASKQAGTETCLRAIEAAVTSIQSMVRGIDTRLP